MQGTLPYNMYVHVRAPNVHTCTCMYKHTYLQAAYGGGEELVPELSGVHQQQAQVLVGGAVLGPDVLETIAA